MTYQYVLALYICHNKYINVCKNFVSVCKMQFFFKVWTNYEPAKEVAVEIVPTERVVSQKSVVVTEVCSDLHFYVQYTDNSMKLLLSHLSLSI